MAEKIPSAELIARIDALQATEPRLYPELLKRIRRKPGRETTAADPRRVRPGRRY